MIGVLKHWIISLAIIASALVACLLYFGFVKDGTDTRYPRLISYGINKLTGEETFVVTNDTDATWIVQFDLVRGLPKPSVFIDPVGIEEPASWCVEYEEGIGRPGLSYSRDPDGRYSRTDRISPGDRITVGETNVVLKPFTTSMAFTAPVIDIPELTKVSVLVQEPPRKYLSMKLPPWIRGFFYRIERALFPNPRAEWISLSVGTATAPMDLLTLRNSSLTNRLSE